MNFVNSLLFGAPGWFVMILSLSFQAALLCALVFGITKMVGRWIPPMWRALLWFVVVVRLLVPFSPPTPLSLQNLWRKPPPPPVSAPVLELPTTLLAPASPQIPIVTSVPSRRIENGMIVASIWGAGTFLALVFLLVRCLAIRSRLTLNASPVPEQILQTMKSSRYPIRVSLSNQLAAPALTGLLPARLILPTDIGERFRPAQLRHILRHELAHIQQGHLLLHWLTLVARALHWFNPFIHLAAVQLRRECELAADAAALKNSLPSERRQYGETILSVLAQTTLPRTTLALGMAEEARHIQQRLCALTNPTRSFRPLGAVLLLTVTVSGLTSAETTPAPTLPSPLPRQSEPTPAVPEKLTIDQQMRNARLLIEVGRLDEAEAILKDAVKKEPENRAALHYLDVIKTRQYARTNSIENSWNQSAASTQISASGKRRELWDRLEKIHLDEFPLPNNTDLIEVLRSLNAKIKKSDPNGNGINLLIAQSADRPTRTAEAIESLRRLPVDSNTADVDVERFQVRFDLPIHDVTLRQLLDAIVMMARPPVDGPPGARLRYSVEDYAIVFSQRPWEAVQLFTRTYRLDPNTFRQGLEGIRFSPNPFEAVAKGPDGSPQTSTDSRAVEHARALDYDRESNGLHLARVPNISSLQNGIRAFFNAAGLDFATNAVPNGGFGSPSGTKAIFYNDQTGILFVRATLADLDKIENILHTINAFAGAPAGKK